MKFQIGMGTDPGLKRQGRNQDYIGIAKPGWFNRHPVLLLLADGMGGYHGGEIASRAVIETFIKHYRTGNNRLGYPTLLRKCLALAHHKVQTLACRRKENEHMGSTLVAAVLDGCEVSVINVGDSRAYHIHHKKMIQLSQDQSFVGNLVRTGEITPDEARTHPKRNVLNMSISAARQEVEPYTGYTTLAPNDILLLCSDGLWSVVPEAEIFYYAENFSPQEAVDDLIKLANDYGGTDNISIIIARCTGTNEQQSGEDCDSTDGGNLNREKIVDSNTDANTNTDQKKSQELEI